MEAELQHEQISHEEEGDNDELDRLKRENQETKQTVHKLHGEITNLISQVGTRVRICCSVQAPKAGRLKYAKI